MTITPSACIKIALQHHEWDHGYIQGKPGLVERLLRTAPFAANKAARDEELNGLIAAVEVLRRQRGVAIAIEAGAEHLAELDAEELAYINRARELGAAWTHEPTMPDMRGWPDHLPPAEAREH